MIIGKIYAKAIKVYWTLKVFVLIMFPVQCVKENFLSLGENHNLKQSFYSAQI